MHKRYADASCTATECHQRTPRQLAAKSVAGGKWHAINFEKEAIGPEADPWYKQTCEVKMNPDDLFVPVKHTCTYEEQRFGTCKCRQNHLRANNNLSSGQRSPLPGNFVWPLRQEERAQLKAELHQRLSALTSGRRILHLRTALGWSQRRAAMELGISRRTLIRHEQGLYGSQWTRNVLLMRLQQVEATHEEALIAYARSGRLPAQAL